MFPKMKILRSLAERVSLFIKDFFQKKYAFPVTLLIICILSFGILIPLLGFYWDDLPFIWLMRSVNPSDLRVLDNHRPLSGWLYSLIYPWLGLSPLRWQIFNLINRYLLGLSAWWSLSSILKPHRKEAEYIALLFILYPGFEHQFVSVNTSRHILSLVIMLLSFGITAKAVQHRERYGLLTLLALGLSLISMLMSDYFYTLELLRPFSLFQLQQNPEKKLTKRVRRVLTKWWPYLLTSIVIFVWRFFLIEQIYYPIRVGEPWGEEFTGSIPRYFSAAVRDIYLVGFTAWKNAFQLPAFNEIGIKAGLISWIVIGLVMLLTLAYFWFSQDQEKENLAQGSTWAKLSLGLISLGLIGMILGGVPAWAANLPIRISGVQSRLTLPMMLGASFVIIGAFRFIRQQKLGIILLAITAGFASGRAIQNAAEFRLDWERQRSFFWQMVWRVPSLEKGTVILTNELPFKFETDNSITPIINWLYAPGNKTDQMDYMVYDIKLRLGDRLPSLEGGHKIDHVYRKFSTGRTIAFRGSTSQSLIVSYVYPSCLRVIQPFYDGHSTGFSPAVVQAFDLSDPDLIQAVSVDMDPSLYEIYGPEPEADWCYYYEKADLARQFGEWDVVYELTEAALSLPSSPNHPSEYILLIEALGRMREYSRALELTQRVLERDPALDRMLCAAWERIEAETQPVDDDRLPLVQARSEANCR